MLKPHENNARAQTSLSIESECFKDFQTIWSHLLILQKKAKPHKGLVACLRLQSYLGSELGLESILFDIYQPVVLLQKRPLEATVGSQTRERWASCLPAQVINLSWLSWYFPGVSSECPSVSQETLPCRQTQLVPCLLPASLYSLSSSFTLSSFHHTLIWHLFTEILESKKGLIGKP